MPKPIPPSFHLRLPLLLKEKLNVARRRRSLNAEIVTRLEDSFGDDTAWQLAEMFRPVLKTLTPAEAAEFVAAVAAAVAVIKKSQRQRRPKK